MWNIINDNKIKYMKVKQNDLIIGEIYIVKYEDEYYRGKLTNIYNQQKYKVKY